MIQIIIITVMWFVGTSLSAEESVEVVGHPNLLVEQDYYLEPTWSPNEAYIAFSSANYSGITIFELSTREIKTLTEEPSSGFWKKWSPDSQHILSLGAKYNNRRRTNRLSVWDIWRDKRMTIIDYTIGSIPKFDWANNQLVTLVDKHRIKYYDIESSKYFHNPSQSVDPFYYFLNNNIYSVDNLRSEPQIIFSQQGEIIDMVVSPNRLLICYEVLGGNLWISHIDGSIPIDLGIGSHPSWSPDNSKVVYMVAKDDGYTITSSELFVVNSDGSNKINITNTNDLMEMNPDWSPFGKYIVYNTYTDGDIYTIEVR